MLIEKVQEVLVYDGEKWVTIVTRFIRDIFTQESVVLSEDPQE